MEKKKKNPFYKFQWNYIFINHSYEINVNRICAKNIYKDICSIQNVFLYSQIVYLINFIFTEQTKNLIINTRKN